MSWFSEFSVFSKFSEFLGRPKCQKKKWYSTKPTFWRSGMGKAWKFKISQFLVISGVLRFFTRFGRPFHYIIWKRQSWLKIWKGNPKKLGDMPEQNSHNSWKQVCNIFLVETKKQNTNIAGIWRKFAGISRKFADICFNHFKTNISGMCGHGPNISRSRLSIFYFHRTNSPNPWRPDLKENEAVGAAIWQNHLSFFLVLSQFLFSIAFFQTKMVHRVFFLHSGFAGLLNFLCFLNFLIFLRFSWFSEFSEFSGVSEFSDFFCFSLKFNSFWTYISCVLSATPLCSITVV